MAEDRNSALAEQASVLVEALKNGDVDCTTALRVSMKLLWGIIPQLLDVLLLVCEPVATCR